jgi:trans-aconitate 2-methyltransferase
MPTWDPDQYLRFADHRLRPAIELIDRIPPIEVWEGWDLGCGAGNVTALLAERFPEAHLTGLDSSPEMIDTASATPGIEWVVGDIDTWDPGHAVDLIFANAALHWIDDHDSLFPRLMRHLRPGGVLAVQMPRNFSEPSHQLLYETARDPRWADRTADRAGWEPVDDPARYYDRLAPEASPIDLWETRYLQVLDGDDPVAQWTKGSAARPFLEAAGDHAAAFFRAYAERLREAYPKRPDGRTVFPFRRLFIVAVR